MVAHFALEGISSRPWDLAKDFDPKPRPHAVTLARQVVHISYKKGCPGAERLAAALRRSFLQALGGQGLPGGLRERPAGLLVQPVPRLVLPARLPPGPDPPDAEPPADPAGVCLRRELQSGLHTDAPGEGL